MLTVRIAIGYNNANGNFYMECNNTGVLVAQADKIDNLDFRPIAHQGYECNQEV